VLKPQEQPEATTRPQLLTWVEHQVTRAEVFHQEVGAELDAPQVAVTAAEVEREDGGEVEHQAGPAHLSRGCSHELCGGERWVAKGKAGEDAAGLAEGDTRD